MRLHGLRVSSTVLITDLIASGLQGAVCKGGGVPGLRFWELTARGWHGCSVAGSSLVWNWSGGGTYHVSVPGDSLNPKLLSASSRGGPPEKTGRDAQCHTPQSSIKG